MDLQPEKKCLRCEQAFECSVHNITVCQCVGIYLNEEETKFISKQFAGCLCFNCLKELQSAYHIAEVASQLNKYPGK